MEIKGLGEKTVQRIMETLSDPRFFTLVQELKKEGLSFEASQPQLPVQGIFSGQSWCVTGSFDRFKPRDLAMAEVKQRGGQVVGDVSSRTTHLLAGEKAGSKLAKAEKLGIAIVNEQEFLKLIGKL